MKTFPGLLLGLSCEGKITLHLPNNWLMSHYKHYVHGINLKLCVVPGDSSVNCLLLML